MAAYGYLDHDDPAPDARTAQERLAACGYPSAEWGENIASGYATAQAVVDAWLASPEHRANIERPEFRATGVGAAARRPTGRSPSAPRRTRAAWSPRPCPRRPRPRPPPRQPARRLRPSRRTTGREAPPCA